MIYVESSEIGAKIPPTLPPDVKFDITGAMIQLFILKGVFTSLATSDANTHLANFMGSSFLYYT